MMEIKEGIKTSREAIKTFRDRARTSLGTSSNKADTTRVVMVKDKINPSSYLPN
jgi:hypothetical protein